MTPMPGPSTTRSPRPTPAHRTRPRFLVVALFFWLATAANPAQPAPSSPPPKPTQISLEHRRTLVYLYARLGQAERAESFARSILAENPSDKEVLLTLASLHAERANSRRVAELARHILHYYPDDHQGLYFQASALALDHRHTEARAILRNLRSTRFANRPFPYELDLAGAARLSGDWPTALSAYQRLLNQNDLADSLRHEARQSLTQLYREHLPRFSAQAQGFHLQEGRALRTTAEYRMHLEDRHLWHVRYHLHQTHIEPLAPLRRLSRSTHDVLTGVDSAWNPRWSSSAWIGGSRSTPLGGFRLDHTLNSQLNASLELRLHHHATDSLLLEILDGREHRLHASFNWQLNPRWRFSLEPAARALLAENQHIGWATSANWNLEARILADNPEWLAGYRGLWHQFKTANPDPSLVAPLALPTATTDQLQLLASGLVVERFHREGAYLAWEHKLSGALDLLGRAGFDYAFELGAFVYNASAGLRFYPRPSLELLTQGGFESGARTSTIASDLWQFNVAMNWWF